jgi:hypothetical protein
VGRRWDPVGTFESDRSLSGNVAHHSKHATGWVAAGPGLAPTTKAIFVTTTAREDGLKLAVCEQIPKPI